MENLNSKGGLSMAAFYQKFLRKHLDLSSLSVMHQEDNDPYFCTPKGASIFGWAGVAGIPFCFVRGFGETVFAVSPMNGGKDCVHVIARDFSDFLRLLLATGDSAALEQAWQWDEAQFDAFLAENPPTDEQKAVLSQITTVFSLTPMERPWQYLHALQAEFDLSKLKFTEDFYDPEMNPDAPEQKEDWKVYFDGSFWGHHGRERAGREMPVQKWFSWAGRDWFVPSVYVCSKGIVVDFCMRTEASALRGFMEKWGIDPESDESINFTRDEREQMEREHPLSLDFTPSLALNGAKLRTSHGCGVIFLPEQPGFCADAEPAMAHYGLDRAYGWSIRRAAFPFVTKRAPKLKSLAVTMTADEVRVPGARFRADRAGDTFAFSYRGTEYTLAVQEVEPRCTRRPNGGGSRRNCRASGCASTRGSTIRRISQPSATRSCPSRRKTRFSSRTAPRATARARSDARPLPLRPRRRTTSASASSAARAGQRLSLWAKRRRGSFTLRARRCTLRRSTTSTGASASAKLRGKRGRSTSSNSLFL